MADEVAIFLTCPVLLSHILQVGTLTCRSGKINNLIAVSPIQSVPCMQPGKYESVKDKVIAIYCLDFG